MLYNNWPSPTAIKENKTLARKQRDSVDRLSQSPSRVSPMQKFLNSTGTFSSNPKDKASQYLIAKHS